MDKKTILDFFCPDGVPRINNHNQTLEIDYAGSSEGSPADWKEPPKALKQWDDLK